MAGDSEYAVLFCTVPSMEEGRRMARHVVNRRLAACVNLVPGLASIYEWEGEIEDTSEVLLILKTRKDLVQDLTARIVEIHPYDCPEVIALPIASGHARYLKWIDSVTGGTSFREDEKE
jgi:periplasmic divalent cation tolerance protein